MSYTAERRLCRNAHVAKSSEALPSRIASHALGAQGCFCSCLHLVGGAAATASSKPPRNSLKRRKKILLQEIKFSVRKEEATGAASNGENSPSSCGHFNCVNLVGHRNCFNTSNFVGHDSGSNNRPVPCWRLSSNSARVATPGAAPKFVKAAENQMACRHTQLEDRFRVRKCLESNSSSMTGVQEIVRKSFQDTVLIGQGFCSTDSISTFRLRLQGFQCSKAVFESPTLPHECSEHFNDDPLISGNSKDNDKGPRPGVRHYSHTPLTHRVRLSRRCRSSSLQSVPHFHSIILMLLILTLGGSDANLFENHDLTAQGVYGDGMYPIHEQKDINVGLILPHTVFNVRMYRKNINTALNHFPRQFGEYSFAFSNVVQEMFHLTPSPTNILDTLCDSFLPKHISAILYVTNDETYGRNTASSQYFLQLAGYLGIPVIAWNADNSGLEQASQTGLILQLAPSIHHQAHAMLSILVQYQWHAFTIITSQIAGHTDFVETILEKVNQFSDPTDTSTANFKFTIIDTITVEHAEEDLVHVKNSEARILLLYSTKNEGEDIMLAAEALGLTGKNYVWIVTQSIIGENLEGKKTFPVGMLGVHFDTDTEALQAAIVKTIRTFAYGVQSFVSDVRNAHVSLVPDISCQGDAGAKWESGVHFYRSNFPVGWKVQQGSDKGTSSTSRFNLSQLDHSL
ncbi:Receptor ligand binding region [Trinorchestia longiramus]|nr:Receptor ligand binding region [Trinorchestia longiramus]